MSLLFSVQTTEGPSPSFSRVPGRNGSMRMSAVWSSFWTSESPGGDLRFTVRERLWDARRSGVG